MVVTKVKMMKSIFNDADVTILLDYVKNFENLSIEELIEGYLALAEEREAVEAERKKKEAEEEAARLKKVAEEEAARKKKEAEQTPKGDERTPTGETPRGENPRGFTDDVVKKVKALKMLFQEADVAILLDFVATSPEDAEVDELVDEYLALAEENNTLFKSVEDAKKEEEPKFDEKVVSKAKMMKEVFSETDLKELCQFISNVPEDLSLDELVESYLQ
jgi:spore cortex formation protein SpoVR/YcgB (stage V sporulation)